jgi:hypothetical protein
VFGASAKRQDTSAPADVGALADVVLKDSSGHDVRLGDLWQDRPAVLVFLRHYG